MRAWEVHHVSFGSVEELLEFGLCLTDAAGQGITCREPGVNLIVRFMGLIDNSDRLFVTTGTEVRLASDPGQVRYFEGIVTCNDFELLDRLFWLSSHNEEVCVDTPRLGVI